MYPQSPPINTYDPKTLMHYERHSTPRGWCYRLAIPFVISNAIQNLGLPSIRSS
jgi:hypothetical protein